jgi:polynucleotide 5'-hydroxyl-kinase GRC3/NOL9
MDIIPEEKWKNLARVLGKDTVLIIGHTDSGKSTLARYLLGELVGRGLTTALVDADIGQSSLGLPGTIAMRVFRSPEDLSDFTFGSIRFVGTFTPALCIREMIDGTAGMARAAKEEGAQAVLVDTTGLVKGEFGLALKTGKVRALHPRHVIAIEAADEMAHLLPRLRGVILHRLKPSRFVRQRSREARVRYRNEKLARYFSRSRALLFSAESIEFLRRRKPFDVALTPPESGTLVGLSGNEVTIALGVWEAMAGGKARIRSPLPNSRAVKKILLGDVLLKDGE